MSKRRKYKCEIIDEEADKWLRKVKFFVEADSFKANALWKEFSIDGERWAKRMDEDFTRVEWEQESAGFNMTIGHIEVDGGDLPIVISFSFATINGVYVCFYNACSLLVHHGMVDNFLRTMYPVKYDKNTRLAFTDASNFHNVFHFCKEKRNKRFKLSEV